MENVGRLARTPVVASEPVSSRGLPATTHRALGAWGVLGVCLTAAMGALMYLASYGVAAVHPHYFLNNMPALVPEHLPLHWVDLRHIFYPFGGTGGGIGEFRPRFLMYLVLLLDHHLRFFLYDYSLIPPTLSLAWVLQLVVGPVCLYRLMMNLAGSRQAAALTLAVYGSSVGFLSGFSVAFAPGKPLTNVVFIVVLYLASVLDRRGPSGQPLFAIAGAAKYGLGILLFAGAFLDEIPLFAFLLVVLIFPDRFVPPTLRRPDGARAALNLAALAAPLVAFIVFSVAVAPAITDELFHYRFDYLGTLLNRTTPNPGEVFGVFAPARILLNALTLLGSATVPQQLAGPDPLIPDLVTYSLPVAALVVMLGLAFWRASTECRRLIARAAASVGAFIVFFAIISGRHGGGGFGFYYGSAFAVPFSMLLGITFAAIEARRRFRTAFLALTVLVTGLQINNAIVAQSRFTAIHDAISAEVVRGQIAVDPTRHVTYRELQRLWKSWKHRRLNERVTNTPVSPGAIYLVTELTYIDRLRPR